VDLAPSAHGGLQQPLIEFMSSRSFRVGRSATGLGLFATKLIERAAYIVTYRGRRISTKEADQREGRNTRYLFALNSRWVIDGSPRWNLARYINHSCRPNAEPVVRKGRIVLVALRSIVPGEQMPRMMSAAGAVQQIVTGGPALDGCAAGPVGLSDHGCGLALEPGCDDDGRGRGRRAEAGRQGAAHARFALG
jgi:hypothetical protein